MTDDVAEALRQWRDHTPSVQELVAGWTDSKWAAEVLRAAARGDLVPRAERDNARAIARVLAHSYTTDSTPPRSVVREALAFPVRPETSNE